MTRARGIVTLAALTCVLHACVGSDDGDPSESTVTQAVQVCPTTMVMGLDVYDGTGTINWSEVKGSGYDFAFIKATQGNYDKQTTFGSNWANAATAGVQRSAYHFFDPSKDGSAQATWFLDELTAAGGMTDADLPPLLDIECPTSTSQTASESGCEYAGDSGWVATATMKQRIYDYLAAVEAAVHRKPILYSYPSWFASVDFTDAQLAGYPLFIASYGACSAIPVPAPWTQATFWQYNDVGTVHGIAGTGDVDVDRYFGSAGDLATWNAGTIERDAGVDGGTSDGGDAGDGDGGVPGDAGTGKHGAGCDCDSSGGGGGAPATFAFGVLFGAVVLRRRR